MEMVIKIDSQAFLASLQDVVRQIQAGCTEVTWQLGMQASEPTPVHSLTNVEDLAVPVCTVDDQENTGSKCQVVLADSIPHSEVARLDGPSDLVDQAMQQQAATPNAVAQFDTVTRAYVAQRTAPTPLPVAPTATLMPVVSSSPSSAELIVKQEETTYTLEMVRARLAQLMSRGEGAFVRAVLAYYGATKLPQVAPQNYQDIMKKVGEKDT